MATRPRLRPSQASLLLGIAVAAVTVLLGAIPAITKWEDESPVTRHVFGNIPAALEVVFYTVLPVLFIAVGWLFSRRARNWERGQPDARPTTPGNVRRRLRDFNAGVFMKTLLRDPAAGVMHSLIYFPFIILFGV